VLVHFPAENMCKLYLLHLLFQRKTREHCAHTLLNGGEEDGAYSL
jgi:hypothetical protein